MGQKSIKKNLFYSIIQKALSLLMPVITFPYASRILLPEGIGKVNFAHSIVSYFVMIAGLGIFTYAIREGAKLRDDKVAFSKFSREIITINLTATIISYVLLFLTLLFVKKLHPYTVLIIICSTTMILAVFGVNWLYNAQEEFKYISIRSIFFQILSLIYLFVFVHSKEDIIHYTIFGILSSTGSNIFNFIHSFKFIDWKVKVSLEIKKHLRPIFILFGMTAAQTVYLVLDISILGFISGDEAVGFYTAASKINKMVIGILAVQNGIILPRLSYYSEYDPEKYKSLLIKTFEFCIMLTLPCLIGFCILSKDLLMIFCGINYLPAINTMYILNFLILFITLSMFLQNAILTPFRKDKYCLYCSIFGAITNLILNFTLIPKLAHEGAAIATIVAEFIVSLSTIFFCIKTIGFVKGLVHNLYQYIISSTIMGIIVYFMHTYFSEKIIFLIIEILIGAIVYYLLLLLFKNKIIIQYSKFFISKFQILKKTKE